MKIYRVATGRTIAPFGDLARDLFIGTQTLAAWHEAAAQATGLELVDVDDWSEVVAPAYAFADDVWFTEMVLRHFVADTMKAKTSSRLALDKSLVTELCEPLQDAHVDGDRVGFDVFFCAADPEQLEGAPMHVVKAREMKSEIRLPPSAIAGEGRSRDRAVPLTARVVANVRHWIHLLKLSQLSIGVSIIDALRREPRLMLKLRLMRNKDPWELGPHLRFVHPTARVHPTAHIESSVVGPNVVIEAHAHVHRSVIGANVRLGDHAAVMGCTLADGVQVLRGSYLAHCVSMPDATLASYKVQLSLFGREVFLTSSAWLIDAKLVGEVAVKSDAGLVPVGPFLGCCLGHRVTLGAQVAIQAGRAVPNGLTIVGPPEHFLSHVEALPEGTVLAVRGGRAEPIGGGG
ncbi:MAG: hypothetical protein RMA76_24335 [Deltaproteobacteria bacterium]